MSVCQNVARHLKILLLPGLLLPGLSSWASPEDGRVFSAAGNAMVAVSQALNQARADQQLALIIAGADWCHDSRALAARTGQAPLAALLESRYETVFVDLGHYERGRDVMQWFGRPAYYATPTVLIVDPASNQVINNLDGHLWGNAAAMTMDESMAYFQSYQPGTVPPRLDRQAQRSMNRVDGFEARQARRVEVGYRVVGPLLKALAETGKKPAEFDQRWNELAGFRNQLAADLAGLRTQIVNGKAEKDLEWPVYPPLSWEAAHAH